MREQRAKEGYILYKGDGAERLHAYIVCLPAAEPDWAEYTIAEYEEWKKEYMPDPERK